MQQSNWTTGTLPSWLAVGLIGLVAYGLREFHGSMNKAIEQLQSHEVRITVLEKIRAGELKGSPDLAERVYLEEKKAVQ